MKQKILIGLLVFVFYILNTRCMEFYEKKESEIEKPKISENLDLLYTFCTLPPDFLIQNPEILDSMLSLSLFDIFCASGWLENQKLAILFETKFAKFTSHKEEFGYLTNYLDLIIKIAESKLFKDNNEKNILVNKLVEKLGTNLGFLDSVTGLIAGTKTFASETENIRILYKNSGQKIAGENFFDQMKNDGKLPGIIFVWEEINKFRDKIYEESLAPKKTKSNRYIN